MEITKIDEFIEYPRRGRIYQHYNGGTYAIISMGEYTTTGEIMVVYRSIEFGSVYVRPFSEFFEKLPEDTSIRQERRFMLL